MVSLGSWDPKKWRSITHETQSRLTAASKGDEVTKRTCLRCRGCRHCFEATLAHSERYCPSILVADRQTQKCYSRINYHVSRCFRRLATCGGCSYSCHLFTCEHFWPIVDRQFYSTVVDSSIRGCALSLHMFFGG